MTALLKLSLNDRGAFTAAELRQGHMTNMHFLVKNLIEVLL